MKMVGFNFFIFGVRRCVGGSEEDDVVRGVRERKLPKKISFIFRCVI